MSATESQPVPMVDLHRQYMALQTEIDSGIAGVLARTSFIMGEDVKAFEAEAAAYLGVDHAISCGNGTDALQLALRALDLGPGDEVITTPFTFIATAEAIGSVGAVPVFVDIDPDTWLMDVDAVSAAISERTRAVLPVHLFGLPTDMPSLQRLAVENGLKIVEDCAQSFGAQVDGKQTGSIGDLGCFSFFPSKNLGAFGDGGMVTTNDDVLAERLRVFRSHGSTQRYVHTVLGCNSRLDELQAAILRKKLPHIDRFNTERRRVAARYGELLHGLPLQFPQQRGGASGSDIVPVFHQYTVMSDQRDEIREALTAANIASAIYYPIPLHHQQAMLDCMPQQPSLPVAELACTRCVSLPIYPELDDETIQRIAGVVRGVIG